MSYLDTREVQMSYLIFESLLSAERSNALCELWDEYIDINERIKDTYLIIREAKDLKREILARAYNKDCPSFEDMMRQCAEITSACHTRLSELGKNWECICQRIAEATVNGMMEHTRELQELRDSLPKSTLFRGGRLERLERIAAGKEPTNP